ncbi:MAG: FxsA family protein [Pseudomonadota bacterium]
MIRTIFFVLFALGLLELFVLVKTGQWFGAWFPVLAVILGFVAGGLTIRHTGIRSLNEIAQASRSGQSGAGAQAAVGGMLGFFAGILFILPGLLSDLAAILLLVPVSRRLVEAYMVRNGVRQDRAPGSVVIDGEAVEIIDDRLPPQEKNDSSPWNR